MSDTDDNADLRAEIRATHPGLAARADAGSPLAALRLHCLGCVCGVRAEVVNCTSPKCELFPFRLGRRPGPGRVLTEEQRAAGAKRLADARAAKAEQAGGDPVEE